MNELRAMIEAADRAAGPVYLATVVDVEGSAYRREGARMLIVADGARIGSISGGCLERDLCRAAPTVTATGPSVVRFDTRADAAGANVRYDLGCSGVIQVLVERVGGAQCPLAPVRGMLERGERRVVGTVYHTEGEAQPSVGTRLERDDLRGSFAALRPWWDRVERSARPVRADVRGAAGSCRILIESIAPPRPLWVFGVGDGARALCALAAPLGWAVTVIGGPNQHLSAAGFPAAERRVSLDARDLDAHLAPSPDTAAVMMTHDFDRDARVVPWLLAQQIGYVGLLGPKARTARLMRRLHEDGALPTAAALDVLHSPAGLDLGADTPQTVALSILAEIVASDHARTGGKLSDRTGPIHDPSAAVSVGPGSGRRAAERAVVYAEAGE